jgi:class 3 adenylate cyclase
VVCCRLPGFAELAETSAPEELMRVLHEYHTTLDSLISRTEATVGPLNADEVMVFFNDPLPVDDPAQQAVELALAMRERLADQAARWRRSGYHLGFGMGIDLGYATLGTVGLEGRTEYGAVGPVVHVAERLRDAAEDRQILISQRVQVAVEERIEGLDLGERSLPGLGRPTRVFALERMRPNAPRSAAAAAPSDGGPLTAREREVAALIAGGYTNRQIAQALVVADATAVRHVANILNKLSMNSRAQVAAWAIQHGLAGSSSESGSPA